MLEKTLALDISTKSTGWCILENTKVLEHGVLSPTPSHSLLRRLWHMHSELRKVQSLHEPQRVVIEELKVLKNQKTLVSLGIAQGMLISACGNIPVEFVSPSVWRKSFGLSGLKREEAKKGAIAKAQSLGYKVANDDEAEAVLIGIHYANNSKNTFRDFKVLKRSASRAQRK